MATAYHVQVPPTDSGILKFAQTGSSAAKVSELLQKDLEVVHLIPVSITAYTDPS